MRKSFRYLIWFYSALLLSTHPAFASGSDDASSTTHIAVASNFNQAMKALIKNFQTSSNHKVTVSYASSGKHYAQIHHGAPYDLFLSADQDKPLKLAKRNFGNQTSIFTYASGQLALLTNTSSATHQTAPSELLISKSLSKLAIANPKHAPYGIAATQVLEQLSLKDYFKGRLVVGENISQAYQFVRTGNVPAGFVALSQIIAAKHPKNEIWVVPDKLHAPILQDAILLNHGKENKAAQAFYQFLRSDTARQIILSFGYK